MSESIQSMLLVEKLIENFKEVTPDLKPKQAIEEANRCLYCYDAPCIKACPTSIDIPSFIKSIATGNMKGSARTILEANPVGATCARVCPTEELCEGACVLNDASLPIMIGDLQRHATNWAMDNNVQLFQPGESNGVNVAIIGGGPAGLSAARELARLGYKVTIFESKEKAGGLDTYGIVSFRLPISVSLWEVEQVRSLGVEIKTNVCVGKDISIHSIVADFDAVVLAVGMAKVPQLGIEGEQLKGVLDAITFVEDTKTKPLTDQLVGKKVVVIGAGNTAIDAATCAVRSGAASVKMVYRRTEKEMTAYPFEYEFAKQDGVEFHWLTQPMKVISDEQENITHLQCVRMQLKESDASGRRKPVTLVGSEFLIEADIVIRAIGQQRHQALLEAFDIEVQNGVVVVNEQTGQTSNSKIFAAGDVIFGNGQGDATVVSAAEQGKKVAYGIHHAFLAKAQL